METKDNTTPNAYALALQTVNEYASSCLNGFRAKGYDNCGLAHYKGDPYHPILEFSFKRVTDATKFLFMIWGAILKAYRTLNTLPQIPGFVNDNWISVFDGISTMYKTPEPHEQNHEVSAKCIINSTDDKQEYPIDVMSTLLTYEGVYSARKDSDDADKFDHGKYDPVFKTSVYIVYSNISTFTSIAIMAIQHFAMTKDQFDGWAGPTFSRERDRTVYEDVMAIVNSYEDDERLVMSLNEIAKRWSDNRVNLTFGKLADELYEIIDVNSLDRNNKQRLTFIIDAMCHNIAEGRTTTVEDIARELSDLVTDYRRCIHTMNHDHNRP